MERKIYVENVNKIFNQKHLKISAKYAILYYKLPHPPEKGGQQKNTKFYVSRAESRYIELNKNIFPTKGEFL
jgi:hypothetical protein